MSPHNNKPPLVKPEKLNTTGRKPPTAKLPHAPSLKCPRCNSPNTKFCYYNNYNLSQPRHFCKTCRRYWTKGGALRNVPIGGGSRKNKGNKSSSTVSGNGGLKLFHGLSPAMDFHRPNPQCAFNPFSSIGDFLSSGASDISNPNPISGSGLFHSSSLLKQGENGKPLGFHGVGGMNLVSHLTPSIESLSPLNQYLHLKLQQQRLAMVFGANTDHQREHFVHERMGSCPNSTNIESNDDDDNNNNWSGVRIPAGKYCKKTPGLVDGPNWACRIPK